MPKVITPFTVTQIKNAKPKSKSYRLTDGNGLALRITPFEAMTLAEARAWRDEIRNAVLSGKTLALLNGVSFEEVFAEWFERWRKTVGEKYGKRLQLAI